MVSARLPRNGAIALEKLTTEYATVCPELGGYPDPPRPREFRTKRVKEARDEAKKEIADYKAQKEEEFKKFEAEHSKGNEAAEQEANKEAEKQIEVIKEAGKKSQATVVKNLLEAVFEVKPAAA
ncbi:vacuolar atpase [Trichoderma arundinaceum]|uniref:V-type proton ATPase subunit G n=1 Tax=Trichoderma arundinaceum TaxID=490622 RepID=A0A395NF08_TRIAR|nr:vacuolar atpase [Trichoderma arundinaceum]